MNVTVETTPESDATFHVSLPWLEIDRASDRVYKRLASQQKVPGFRPGHAPRSMLERMVGKDALYEEAIDNLVDDAVRASAREHELVLLAHPHAHVHQIDYGQDHQVTVTVPVLGKGELADYHDILVLREPVEVTEEDIDNVITRAREQSAAWVPVDRPAAMGDRVTVDMTFTVNDKEISNLKEHDFDLVPDRTGIYVDMDAAIVGMTEGETKAFTTTLPADYPKTEMAGQPGQYSVTLTKIAIKELPAVDDEFARTASGLDTLAALRENIREQLRESKQSTALRDRREKTMEALTERLTLAVPPVLVDAEAEDILTEMDDLMRRENIALDQYLKLMGSSREQYVENVKPEAMRRIRMRRALERLAESENLMVTSAEIQRVLDSYGAAGGRGHTRINQLRPEQRRSLEMSLLRDKATDWALEHLVTDDPAVATIIPSQKTTPDTDTEAPPAADAPTPTVAAAPPPSDPMPSAPAAPLEKSPVATDEIITETNPQPSKPAGKAARPKE